MARFLGLSVLAMGAFWSSAVQPLRAEDPMSPEEKRAAAAVGKVVEDLIGAFKRGDLDAMRKLYDQDKQEEYTKRNLEYFRKLFQETKNLKAEFKTHSIQAVSTTANVVGEIRLSAENKRTGGAYFPDYSIPCYIGLDKSFGDSPWHVRVFLIEIDETAIKRRLQAFYDAFVEKNEEKVMTTWATKLGAKALAEKRETLRSMLSTTGPIKLVSLEMEETEVDGDQATARVKVELSANVAKTGESYLAGVMDLDWKMVREGMDWKAVGFALHKASDEDKP